MKQLGDKGVAACWVCDSWTVVTYARRIVPFSVTEASAEILAGVCDMCGSVITMPHTEENINAIREAKSGK
jgi:hypothetical protein